MSPLYLPPASAGVGATVETLEITDDAVTSAKLSAALRASMGKANTAVQPGDLGDAATLDVGTTSGTVAAGAHVAQHATGGADPITPVAIGAAAAADLGTAAALDVGTTIGTVAAGDDSRIVAGGTSLQPDAAAAAFAPAVVLTGAGIDLTGATDSTAAIQALLTANPRRTIRSVPGATYKITSTLTCYSGQHLALTGGTFSLIGCADEMLVNSAAVTAQRTVADAATTAASTTITSATAAFTSADVGRAVVIATAGPSGGTLAANIASVTNATTAVLDTAAIDTVTDQSMSIYDRDTNITVEGGTFLRDATASVAHMLHFRRVDNLTVRPDRVVTSGGKYSVSFGHVTDFSASGGSWTTHSDGVHVNGPAKRGLICGMRGTSGDNFVSLAANDYAAYADVAGDISDIVIDNISCTAASHGAGNTVKVLAGENCKVRNVAIDGITGTSQRNIVALIDDGFGQDIDGITIGSIVGVPADGYSLLEIAGAGVGAVSVGQVILGKAATASERGINIGEAVTGLCLHVGTIATPTAASNNLLNIRAGATWTAIMVDRIQGVFKADQTAGRSISIASASGPISVGRIVQTGGRMIVHFNAATGTQPLTIGAIHSTNIGDGIWVSHGGSLNLDLGTWAGEEPGNRCIDVSGTGAVLNATVAGSRIVGNKFLLRSGSPGTIRINGATAQVDCTLLTPLAGDVVYNTNALAACGVGLVTSDGTTWRRVDSGAIRTGVATLSSGTVTVADAAITANSVIRIGTKTIGGTPGAVYVSVRTAGASFAITSTSATDTSVVQYWIDAY